MRRITEPQMSAVPRERDMDLGVLGAQPIVWGEWWQPCLHPHRPHITLILATVVPRALLYFWPWDDFQGRKATKIVLMPSTCFHGKAPAAWESAPGLSFPPPATPAGEDWPSREQTRTGDLATLAPGASRAQSLVSQQPWPRARRGQTTSSKSALQEILLLTPTGTSRQSTQAPALTSSPLLPSASSMGHRGLL